MTEKRKETRFAIEARIKWANSNRIIESNTRDISYSGVFVETLAPCAIGEKIKITIPVINGTIETEGEVRWIREDEEGIPEGMGIYFLRELSRAEKDAVKIMLIGSNTETLIG